MPAPASYPLPPLLGTGAAVRRPRLSARLGVDLAGRLLLLGDRLARDVVAAGWDDAEDVAVGSGVLVVGALAVGDAACHRVRHAGDVVAGRLDTAAAARG